jgi:general secretion pathway protein D
VDGCESAGVQVDRRNMRNPALGWGRVFASLVLAACALCATPAAAQIQPPPPAAVLDNIAVSAKPTGEAQLTLTFDPLAPKFSIIADGTDKPSIAFALSSRGAGAKYPTQPEGLLRSMSIEQNDTILIIHFVASGPVHLTATASGAKDIQVTLAKGTPAPPPGALAAAAITGPLPTLADAPPGQDGFEIVPLKYADVSEVVGLLAEGQIVKPNDGFTPHEPAFGSAGMGGTSAFTPAPAPGADTSEDPLGQSVNDTIGVDRRLNAIILKGSPDRIARLKEKIAEIDVPVQSVILETMFVELTDSDAQNLGINFNNANNQIGTGTFQIGAYIPAGFPTAHGLASANLQAAIAAQIQKGHGRIVSKPRISAQSGSTAKIITGDAIPILTSITLSGVNGVSQQVQYVNVGVTLQIAPRVSSDGYVTSQVFCVVSSVTGTQQGYPTISQREAQTSATVRDGETFVIGGLTQENDTMSHSKLPLLGDIPLLDSIFDAKSDSDSKTDLYIVVTPHIVMHSDPLPEKISQAGQTDTESKP